MNGANLYHLIPSEIAKRIDMPLERWEGNCFGIATAIVNAGVVEGRAVYGHWLGRVSPHSRVFGPRRRLPFQAHGWVVTPDALIVDPTRWAFEAKTPYIFIGPADNPEYDEGGNQFRAFMRGPAVAAPEVERTRELVFTGEAEAFAEISLGHGSPFATRELAWLANTPPAEAGLAIKSLYEALIGAGLNGLIPFDNRLAVMGK